MEDYKNNSDKIQAGQTSPVKEKQTPVTTNVVVKDNNKFLKKIFANDMQTTVKSVNNDVVIPGIKNLIVNALKKGVDYLFNGSFSTPAQNRFSYYDAYTSIPRTVTYSSSFLQPSSQGGYQSPMPRASSIFAVNDIIFPDRGPAEAVLFKMQELIGRYGVVSVLDFYDLVGQKTSPQQNKYGWRDLSMATVSPSGDGYHINFPKVVPIE